MPPALENLKQQLLADKKKLGLMCMLVAVGLLLWGRLILLDRVPKTAVADPNAQAAAAKAVPADVERVVYIGRLPDRPTRDVFSLPRDRYRPLPGTDNGVNPGNLPSRSVDEDPADLVEVQGLARELRLRAVIYGIRPRIVLDDRMLKTGDTYNGFKVLAIEKNAAVIARDGYLFRLRVTGAR